MRVTAEELYEQARAKAIEQNGADPAVWPPWEELSDAHRQAMLLVLKAAAKR